jgi:hypothetical protein
VPRDEPFLIDGRPATDLLTAVTSAASRHAAGRAPAAVADPPVHPYSEQTMTFEEKVNWLLERGIEGLRLQAVGEFDLDRLPPLHEFSAEWAQQQLADPDVAPWLVLLGPPGCGKTTQSLCIARHLVLEHARRGERYDYRFVTHRNFAAKVQRGSVEDAEEVLTRYAHHKGLLVFSDLGDFNSQDFGRAVDFTSRLVNHRYHQRMPTIYETNLLYDRDENIVEQERQLQRPIATMDQLLDDRVIDRLKAGWTAPLPEVNYRRPQGRVMGV